MQVQTYAIACLATLEAAQPLDWQAEAVGDYEQSLPIRHADLRTDLSARIHSRASASRGLMCPMQTLGKMRQLGVWR